MKTKYGTSPFHEKQLQMSFAKTLSSKSDEATDNDSGGLDYKTGKLTSVSDAEIASYSCAENDWECVYFRDNNGGCGEGGHLLFYFPEITVSPILPSYPAC